MFEQQPKPMQPSGTPSGARPSLTNPPEVEDIFAGLETKNQKPSPISSVPSKPSRSRGLKKIILIVLIIIIVILLIAGGVMAYLSFLQQVVPVVNANINLNTNAANVNENLNTNMNVNLNTNAVNINENMNANLNLNLNENLNANLNLIGNLNTNVNALLDSDNDGLPDELEMSLGTSITSSDSDNDGLLDKEEIEIYSTNPLNPDTDGDTYLDGAEVKAGYDPTNPLPVKLLIP